MKLLTVVRLLISFYLLIPLAVLYLPRIMSAHKPVYPAMYKSISNGKDHIITWRCR
jgi:hypothetical protein